MSTSVDESSEIPTTSAMGCGMPSALRIHTRPGLPCTPPSSRCRSEVFSTSSYFAVVHQ